MTGATIAPDDLRLVYMAETDVLAANGMVEVLRDRWFSVHPERGLIFWQAEKGRRGQLIGASPQCNSHEAIARSLASSMYPWAETRFFPLVLLPINLRDYQ